MGRLMLRGWWRWFVESSTSAMSPWDRGVLEAHWMGSVRTPQVLEIQSRAIRRRRGWLAWLLPGRRHYLDGLIWGIQKELKRRGRD